MVALDDLSREAPNRTAEACVASVRRVLANRESSVATTVLVEILDAVDALRRCKDRGSGGAGRVARDDARA
jgi:hypothetical protein